MIFYPYSREDSINQAEKKYIKYLEGIGTKEPCINNPVAYKNFMFHAFCMEVFSGKINTKVFDIIVNASKKAKEMDFSSRVYLGEAISLFNKEGYNSCVEFFDVLPEREKESIQLKNISLAYFITRFKNKNKYDIIKNILKNTLGGNENINTCELLGLSFIIYKYSVVKYFSDYLNSVLRYLLRCFEPTGRVYENYAADSKKDLRGYSIIQNYALLAANFCLLYSNSKDLKVLNALLKLNDVLALFINNEVFCESLPLMVYSFTKEKKAIGELYDTRRFRLSAYR